MKCPLADRLEIRQHSSPLDLRVKQGMLPLPGPDGNKLQAASLCGHHLWEHNLFSSYRAGYLQPVTQNA